MSDGNRSESLADLKPLTLQPSDPMTNDTDTTPNGDLRDLIDRWEEAAQHAKEQGELSEYDGIAGCIDELKAVINDD